MALTSGTKLGPYEIQSPLGAGGMGEVYRAKDTRLDRVVAIKVLASHLSSSSELKQRMEREARAVSSLNHPHICHLYDVGSQDGADYPRIWIARILISWGIVAILTGFVKPPCICMCCAFYLGWLRRLHSRNSAVSDVLV